MKFIECPNCKQKAASLLALMDPCFWRNSKTLCEKCQNGIKLNVAAVISFYTSAGVISIVSLLFMLKFYSLVAFGVWAVLVISLNFLIPYFLVRFFNQRLFLSNSGSSS
jgi:hypothetical protein